jgi:hypothetical protein
MKIRDTIDGSGRGPPRFFALSPRMVAAALLSLTAIALGGCGLGDGAGAMLVDPGHYSAYHCNELVTRWKVLIARETELRGLMEKAREGTGGSLIGSLAYRSDYESVVTEEKLVQRTAADKDCGFNPVYQSDHIIR